MIELDVEYKREQDRTREARDDSEVSGLRNGNTIYTEEENRVRNRFKGDSQFGFGYAKLKMTITQPSAESLSGHRV